MPLPPEVLEKIKKSIDEAEEGITSVTDIIADLRASGIDSSKQEESLKQAKDDLKKLRFFYERQSERSVPER